jgi:uncharacterized membrane protein SirB2
MIHYNLPMLIFCLGYLLMIRKRPSVSLVFFSCVAWSFVSSGFSDVAYYAAQSYAYFSLSRYLVFTGARAESIIICATIALFNAGMALDAQIYPNTETAFWLRHEFLTCVLHITFICSFIDFRRAISTTRQSFINIFCGLRHRYNNIAMCYNNDKTQRKT